MVKNRAPKMAARARASQDGTPYTAALAKHANPDRPLRLVLGLDLDGCEVTWPGRPRSLAVQGPAASGKTTLLTSLAGQALGQAEVYICSGSGRLHVPGAAAHGDGIDSSVELIRTLFKDMKSTVAEAKALSDASAPPDKPDRRGIVRKSVHRPSIEAQVAALPADRRPPRRVLVVDDFDVLCRNWKPTGGGDLMSSFGPAQLVRNLVDKSPAMDISVVVAGESLSRSTIPHDSRLLLGPSTLAEREAFLTADNIGEDPGLWAGLYEEVEFMEHATTLVRLM